MLDKQDEIKHELEKQYIILRQKEAKNQKKLMTIVILISIASFLSIIASSFFSYRAYKNSKLTNSNQSSQKQEVLLISYNGNKSLNLNNITNNYSLTNPIEINLNNSGNDSSKYLIKLNSIKTNLLSTNNLIYTLKKNDQIVQSTSLPTDISSIIEESYIEPNESINYKIFINYNGTIDDNSINYYYQANLEVIQGNEVSTLIG